MAHCIACAALADCVAHTCRGHWYFLMRSWMGVTLSSVSCTATRVHTNTPLSAPSRSPFYPEQTNLSVCVLICCPYHHCHHHHLTTTHPPPLTLPPQPCALHHHQQPPPDHHTDPCTGWGLRATRGVGATSRCFKTSSGTSTTCVTVGSAAMMPFALATATSVMRRTGAPLR